VAIWPVFHLWSLPLLFVLFMGFFMTVDFMPEGHIGSFLFSGLFVLFMSSFYFIEHDGYLHRPHKDFH
jgi:hypothetical protein